MNSVNKWRKDFLNYLEGTLSEQKKAQFEAALKQSAELQNELASYSRIVQMEREVSKEFSKESLELDERFVSKVMAEIQHRPNFLRSLFMNINLSSRQFATAIGGLAVASLCIVLVKSPEFKNVGQSESISQSFSEVAGGIAENTDNGLRSDQPILLKPAEELVASTTGKNETITAKIPKNFEDKLQEIERQASDLTAPKAVSTGKVHLDSEVTALKSVGAIAQNSGTSLETRGRIQKSKEDIEEKYRALTEKAKALPNRTPIAQNLDMAAQMPQMPAPVADLQSRSYISNTSNTERYNAYIENAPVLTKVEPMSTFSIDVDTGSYTNSRRFLQSGQLPPSDAVRIEEFINYFTYNYPTQSKQPFAANFEAAPAPGESGKYLLKIGIKGETKVEDEKRKPWNLTFLIDVSGSMNAPNKLPLVQRSLELLANNMQEGDTVSIVTYAGSSGVLLPPTSIQNRSAILSAISRLQSGGGTHGSAGIVQAYDTAQQAFNKNGVNRVILATDGDFNIGVTNQDELIRLIEEKRKSGITLTTLGFGEGNYNEATMEQLANKGNGNYFYIDGYGEARKVFSEDLAGTIEVIAKDVKLQIEFNPEHVAQYRLVGYENRKLKNEDFANDKIDAGEIGAGHTVTALYELVLTGTDAEKNLSPS
ncbi:MAG: von Willebrand factor type A domain-containing protein, partial [Bdellovibrionales bacterium]|nr:von Willebrand factor type A domain-containing protein [Bdellovibrionales bacterium]